MKLEPLFPNTTGTTPETSGPRPPEDPKDLDFTKDGSGEGKPGPTDDGNLDYSDINSLDFSNINKESPDPATKNPDSYPVAEVPVEEITLTDKNLPEPINEDEEMAKINEGNITVEELPPAESLEEAIERDARSAEERAAKLLGKIQSM